MSRRAIRTTFTGIVRPNADTLYSLLWFDVSQEPLLISVPNSGGRYYLLQMCDMWTDVFDSPGKRTTGTSAQVLAIAGPRWQGQLPTGATLIHSPTAIGWIIGRTQTNGKADYEAVHKFQAGLIATPLSQWGKSYRPLAETINPDWDMRTPPVNQVEKLSPAAYFALFTELTNLNPPHANDYPILHQMLRMGIEPGKPFAFDQVSPEVQRALTEAGEVDARVATRHFRSLQVQRGQFPRPTERLAVRHDFCHDAPFICGTSWQRRWVEQERLGSSCSSAIAPRRKDSVAGHDTRGEMPDILEGRTLGRHDHVRKQRIV